MINTMAIAVAVALGPALALYFLLGRPVKWLIGLAVISFGVVRYFWLSPHATEKMAFIGFCWFFVAGLAIVIRALQKQPVPKVEVQGDPGLNPAC